MRPQVEAVENPCSKLPSTLDDLSALYYFQVSNNQITGNIPSSLGSLSGLYYLFLDGNDFSGSIPATLGNASSLRMLYLQSNSLSGGLPSALGNLTHITRIQVQTNSLNGTIPSELYQLTTLDVLDLSNNQFTGSISSSIGNLTNLTRLVLQLNSFSGSLPTEMGDLSNLNLLALGYNNFSGSIPSSFGNLINMLNLTLSSNNLTGALPSELSNLTKMNLFVAQDNDLEGVIPSSWISLTKLATFSVKDNNLGGRVPAFFTDFSFLTSLQLQNNDFTGFPDFTQHSNPSQITVYISDNHISTTDINANIVGGNPIFSVFTYANQTAAPQGEGNIPDITELGVLQSLYESTGGTSWNNKYGWPTNWSSVDNVDDLIGTFGLTIVNHDITQIDLTSNNLSGNLPQNMGDLAALYYLQLTGNSLTGSIPLSLTVPTNLQYIFLSNNDYAGSLPEMFVSCPNLKMLYLDGNQFSGIIPEELGDLQGIQRLFMQGNDLTGTITGDLYQLTSLVQLDLSSNNLTGTILPSISGLINLDKLGLFHNNISGPIPSEIGDLSNMITLDLSYNNFTDSLPSSIGNLTHLRYLNLGVNDFTGEIPSTFSALTDLLSFTVENNNFSGPIPNYIAGFDDLIVLRTQNNSFTSFPDMTSHVNPGQIDINIAGNQIPQGDIEANIVNGSSIFSAYSYDNQTPLPVDEGNVPDQVELAVLHDIVDSLGVPSRYDWPTLSNWPASATSEDFEAWGIPTYNGDIIELQLDYTDLHGNVPPSINNLTSLEILFLGSNYLTSVPPLDHLVNLKYFELNANNSDLPFPNWLINLQKLEVVNLNSYGYGKLHGEMSPLFSELPNLEQIGVNGNDLRYFPSFKNHPNQYYLRVDVSNNKLPMKYLNDLKLSYFYELNYSNQQPDYAFLPKTKYFTVGETLQYILRNDKGEEFAWEGSDSNTSWQKLVNGSWINVQNDDQMGYGSLRIDNATLPDAGTYRFIVTNAVVTDVTFTGPEIEIMATGQTPQYNGNISAITWKGYQDENENLYLYNYDPMNRLVQANYGEKDPEGWSNGIAEAGFNTTFTYDLNGNIQSLDRQGKDVNVESIDELGYSYTGNQLINVYDYAHSAKGFDDGTNMEGISYGNDESQRQEYFYDANGNMTKDLNKGIKEIEYNYLNLPSKVTMDDGRYLEYIYDASGVKLAQIVHENGETTTTEYDGEFIYKTKDGVTNLELIQHDEGRLVNEKIIVDNVPVDNWVYQYHLKDHLGNVRTTFTSQPKTITYKLNYENDQTNIPDDQELFEDVDISSVRDFNSTPEEEVTYSHSQILYSSPNPQVGSVIAFAVSKGDKISAFAKAKYMANNENPNVDDALTLATALVSAFTGGTTGNTEFGTGTINGSFDQGSLIGQAGFPLESSTAPKAFLNLMFLPDDQTIQLVKGASFAYDQIAEGTTENPIDGDSDNPFDNLSINNFVAPGNGYIIVYVSNEGSLYDVHFDDLEIDVQESPIVQSDDYYPFGLTFNSYKRVTAQKNQYKFNAIEHVEDLDLDLYQSSFRLYDQAIGRFHQVDPLAPLMPGINSYHFGYNNPVRFRDPSGLAADDGVGADGLTNEQWIASSRPNAPEGLANSFIHENRQKEIDRLRKEGKGGSTANSGEADYNDPEVLRFTIGNTVYIYYASYFPNYAKKSNGEPGNDNNPGLGLSDLMKLVPVALIVGADVDFYFGGGGDVSAGGIIILRGPDAGQFVAYLDYGVGSGFDLSIGGEGGFIFYTGDVKNFTKESLRGERTEVSFAYGFLGVNGFMSSPSDIDGGRVIGLEGSYGPGINPLVLFEIPVPWTINVNQGSTGLFRK